MNWLQRIVSFQRLLWLYHFTNSAESILSDQQIYPTKFGYVSATENPDLWSFESNEGMYGQKTACIAFINTGSFYPVKYDQEWADAHPDEVNYITNNAYENASYMGAYDSLSPDAEDEDIDAASNDFVMNALEQKSEEAEWVAEGAVSLPPNHIGWILVKDPAYGQRLRAQFPQLANKIKDNI
jgi:hypothetical protein